jgi:Mn-dependent DtxR family transcriptional regulator
MKRSLDYLLLFYNEGKPLQLKEVSIALNVKPPSALETLNNLVKKGYLKKVKRGTFIITEKGEDYIREIIWKHAVLEHLFLNFNLGTKNLCEIVSKIEEYFSKDIIEKICEKFNHPYKCPHDYVVPHSGRKKLEKYKYCKVY